MRHNRTNSILRKRQLSSKRQTAAGQPLILENLLTLESWSMQDQDTDRTVIRHPIKPHRPIQTQCLGTCRKQGVPKRLTLLTEKAYHTTSQVGMPTQDQKTEQSQSPRPFLQQSARATRVTKQGNHHARSRTYLSTAWRRVGG